MNKWTIRLYGIVSMAIGCLLFVYSVKYISQEWPQIFVGLLSVFFSAVGFGVLIMPLDSPNKTASRDDSQLK
jgi:Na+/phosphate symporter